MSVESIENLIQLGALGICVAVSGQYYYSSKRHEWAMLFLAVLVYFLGDMYLQLYLIFYGEAPYYSHISYLSWYASYLFLILLIIDYRGKNRKRLKSPWMWLIPAFTAGMALFYMLQADYISNIICAVLMSTLIWLAIEGFVLAEEEGKKNARLFYITVLALCFTEYVSWTVSSIWTDDSITNPYFWTDSFLSLIFIYLPLPLRKAVEG